MTDVEALYRQYSPAVFRFALSLSGSRQVAEDLTSADALPYEEIGAALSISPGAAKVRVHRARQRLAALRLARLHHITGEPT